MNANLIRVFENIGRQKTLADLLLIARYTLKSIRATGSNDTKYATYAPDMTRLLRSRQVEVVHDYREHGSKSFSILVRYRGVLFVHSYEERWWDKLISH